MLIAAQVLLPVLFTIALGYLLERWRTLDTLTLSTVSIYVLTPCLVFYSLVTTQLTSHDFLQILLFLPLLTLSLWLLVKVFLWLRKAPPSEEGPAMLCTLFMNAGNYGIPMCRSAFGTAGVEHGVVWVILQNTLLFPLATYYAARDTHGSLAAFKAIFRLPVLYAVFVAILLRMNHIPLPEAALETVKSIGYAMIPVAQILLGVRLGKTAREATHQVHSPTIAWLCVMRLVAAPLIAIPLVVHQQS